MIVLDASAAVELATGSSLAPLVAQRIADPTESLHAPHLLGVEVAQVLRRLVRTGVLEPELAEDALTRLGLFDVTRHEHELLLGRAWQLRENVTAYDGVYLALAELLDAPLLTFDGRLARAPGHSATVELLVA